MVVQLDHIIESKPPTFTHRIVEGFRDPAWWKYWLGRDVANGGLIPTGYGIAWKCWDRDAFVIMPVPLNLVASWLRALWYGGVHGYTLDALAKAEQRGYEEGRLDGQQQSMDRTERYAQSMIRRMEADIRLDERKRVYKEMELSLDPGSPTYWRRKPDGSN